jgi:hypothetical protein
VRDELAGFIGEFDFAEYQIAAATQDACLDEHIAGLYRFQEAGRERDSGHRLETAKCVRNGDDHRGIGGGHEYLAANHAARMEKFFSVRKAQRDACFRDAFRRERQVSDPRGESGAEEGADGGFVHGVVGEVRSMSECVRHDSGSGERRILGSSIALLALQDGALAHHRDAFFGFSVPEGCAIHKNVAIIRIQFFGALAQLVEQRTLNP